MGRTGIRVEDLDQLPAALAAGLGERPRPTVLDVIVIRDLAPPQMFPAIDNHTLEIKSDRVA